MSLVRLPYLGVERTSTRFEGQTRQKSALKYCAPTKRSSGFRTQHFNYATSRHQVYGCQSLDTNQAPCGKPWHHCTQAPKRLCSRVRNLPKKARSITTIWLVNREYPPPKQHYRLGYACIVGGVLRSITSSARVSLCAWSYSQCAF